jgi:hypothetical protein
MGAEPWSYYVPFREDTVAAMEALKEQEFAAGRYRMDDPDNPPATIEDAVADCDADGTGTILDMIGVSNTPHDPSSEDPQFCMVAPLTAEQLHELYGTDQPTHAMIQGNQGFYEWIDRGLGVYIVVYQDGTPSELFFAGYSFD